MNTILGLLLTLSVFSSPVHFAVSLAGNFGEPRPNHLHSGVDIKTEQSENKAIYSIGDGFVSRVVVWQHGYGKAIYVQHPNGLTSIYAHLNGFAPSIEAIIKEYQYKHHTFDCDFSLSASQCPVRKGQLIALSGNTGASAGPHVHLEIHKTLSWDMMDPLDYVDLHLKDHTPPRLFAIKGYPQRGLGVINGSGNEQLFGSNIQSLTAWGKIGFGIKANDYMDGVYNSYGVRFMRLLVDGKQVFSSDVNGVPRHCYRMVNSWGDYAHYMKTKEWFLKTFIEPGNTLPILKAKDRGIINICEERDYHIQIVLSDVFGNTASHTFVVHGRKQAIPSGSQSSGPVFHWNKKNVYKGNGVILTFNKGAIADDLSYTPLISNGNALSKTYSFFHVSTPIFDTACISIRPNTTIKDIHKCFIAMTDPTGVKPKYVPSSYRRGWWSAKIRDLGMRYCLLEDYTPPTIRCLGGSPSALSFIINDNLSGVRHFEATVDGHFVLLKMGKDRSYVYGDLRESPLRPTGQTRQLRVVAIDNCGNKSQFVENIKY